MVKVLERVSSITADYLVVCDVGAMWCSNRVDIYEHVTGKILFSVSQMSNTSSFPCSRNEGI